VNPAWRGRSGLQSDVADLIVETDATVGRVLAALKKSGTASNTLVLFTSDNGFAAYTGAKALEAQGHFPSGPLRGYKSDVWEGGHRVPFLVRWPGVVKPGSVCDTPVQVMDWMPTLLDVAGAPAPPGHKLDGVSLVPLLRGGLRPERALFWYAPFYELRWAATPCAVVRRGDWKLIEYFGDWFDDSGNYHGGARLELFNLRVDLGERQNRAEQERARAAGLRDQLHAWLKSIPAEIPGPNPKYDISRSLKETRAKPVTNGRTIENSENAHP
jgi:arylsulfatase A-like enzyme